MELLEKSLFNNREDCDIILSTVHKSKGSEEDYVYLSNDLFGNEDMKTPLNLVKIQTDDYIEEVNIFYVALTRAKKCVFINEEIWEKFKTLKVLYE